MEENNKQIAIGSRIIITKGIYKGKKGFVYSILEDKLTVEFEYKPFRKQFLKDYLCKIQ